MPPNASLNHKLTPKPTRIVTKTANLRSSQKQRFSTNSSTLTFFSSSTRTKYALTMEFLKWESNRELLAFWRRLGERRERDNSFEWLWEEGRRALFIKKSWRNYKNAPWHWFTQKAYRGFGLLLNLKSRRSKPSPRPQTVLVMVTFDPFQAWHDCSPLLLGGRQYSFDQWKGILS